MWVRSALINRDSQKTDPQIQLLDYLDPSFWGDELRRVQLTTYEDFHALNSVKTRESIEPIPVQQEKRVQDQRYKAGGQYREQPATDILTSDVWQTACLVCYCFLINQETVYTLSCFISLHHSSQLFGVSLLIYICVTIHKITYVLKMWHCYRGQVDKTWEEDTKIVSSILVPLLTALLA